MQIPSQNSHEFGNKNCGSIKDLHKILLGPDWILLVHRQEAATQECAEGRELARRKRGQNLKWSFSEWAAFGSVCIMAEVSVPGLRFCTPFTSVLPKDFNLGIQLLVNHCDQKPVLPLFADHRGQRSCFFSGKLRFPLWSEAKKKPHRGQR